MAEDAAKKWRKDALAFGRKPKTNPVLTKEEQKAYTDIFRVFDTDKSGHIDSKELGEAMKQLGVEASKDEIRDMIHSVDKDKNGEIDINEFTTLMKQKKREKEQLEGILTCFRLMDDDHTGKIDFRNLKKLAIEMGESLTDEEIKEMIDEADRDGDGALDQDDFIRLMKRTMVA